MYRLKGWNAQNNQTHFQLSKISLNHQLGPCGKKKNNHALFYSQEMCVVLFLTRHPSSPSRVIAKGASPREAANIIKLAEAKQSRTDPAAFTRVAGYFGHQTATFAINAGLSRF